MKTDLSFIKDIIEGYKHSLDLDEDLSFEEHLERFIAADQILKLIEDFIEDTNKLMEKKK